jgi:ABC-type multidrug transport system permease subunit
MMTETILVGWRMFRRDAPIRLVVTVFWTRSVVECLLYTTLGLVGGGSAGADRAFVGAVVLATAFYAVALVTDVPQRDRWDGTYPRLAIGEAFPYLAFLLRSLPYMLNAVVGAAVALVVVGLATGRAGTVLDLLPAVPLLLVGTASCVAVGLCIVMPAIGSRLDVVSYNVMLGLMVICSGAVIPRGTTPLLDDIGTALPLTHTISAVRAVQAGRPFWSAVGAECVVALSWGLAGALLLAALQHRGRSRGTGVFA